MSDADRQIKHSLVTGVLAAFEASGKELFSHRDVRDLVITPSIDGAILLDANEINDDISVCGLCLHKQNLLELFRPAEAFEEEFFANEDWTGEMAAFYLEHRTHSGYFHEDRRALNAAAYQALDNLLQQNKVVAFKNGQVLEQQYWFGKSVGDDNQISLGRSGIIDAFKMLDARVKGQGPVDTYANTLQKLSENGRKSSFDQAANYLFRAHEELSKKHAETLVEKDGRFKKADPGRPSKK